MELLKSSITNLTRYDNCPWCFFLNQLRVPYKEPKAFKLGSEVHKAIEMYHLKGIIPKEETIRQYLELYIQHYDWRTPCEVEYYFEFPLSHPKTGNGFGFTLSGHIDRVAEGWIFEHKTSARCWNQKEVDDNLQTTSYAWGYRQKFGNDPKGIRFNVFVKNKTPKLQFLETYPTLNDYIYLFEWVKEKVELIRNDVFEPKSSRWHLYTICPGNRF